MYKITFIVMVFLSLVGVLFLIIDGSSKGDNEEFQTQSNRSQQRGQSAEERLVTDRIKSRRKNQVENSSNELANLLRLTEDKSLPQSKRLEAKIALIDYYSENDPEEGMKWLRSLDYASGEVAGAYGMFAAALARRDPSLWMSYFQKLGSIQEKDYFIRGGIPAISYSNAKEAWGVAEDIFATEPELAGLRGQLFEKVSSQNADEFWEIVFEKALSGGEDAGELLSNFFSHARFKEQSEAINALEGLEPNEGQLACIKNYAKSTLPEALMEFGNALTKSNLDARSVDVGLSSVIDRLFYRNPGDAAVLVKKIHDPKIRQPMITKIRRYAESQGESMASRIDEILSD